MRILVLAPHADDEVLGMGGTIARMAAEGHEVVLAVLTGHGSNPNPLGPKSEWERVRLECREAARILGVKEIHFRELPAAFLDAVPNHDINGVVKELIQSVSPSEIYLPFMHDMHKDHDAISYGALVACRPYLPHSMGIRRVLAYETLSETHLPPAYLVPSFQPNVFINITETLEKKIEAMSKYKSQLQPDNMPRSFSALRALSIIRGTHIGCHAAEAFVLLGEYVR
jgi:LmbE family N-acetylglucosaminyl deacetylase